MKKIFLLTGILAFMLGSCIEDKGSYDYVSVERPEIVLNDQYRAPKIDEETRENLVVRPVVEYSDLSKLTWVYEFTNPANPDSLVVYEGAADGSLDSQIEELPNGQYSVNLTVTVTDDSGIAVGDDPGMKYFYRFEAFLGTTPYMEGVMVLANDGGASKLHFIDIYDVLYEDVYAAENNGAAIPGTPVQMIYPKSFMGSNISYAYMILTDNGGIADGVIIDPVELKKLRTMAENFEPAVTMGAPGMMSMAYNHPFPAQPWGSVVITMGGKAYYSMPFGANPADQKSITFIGDTPVLGSAMPGASMTYEFTDFAPNKNNIGSPALFWAYDANAKALRLFMAGMMSVPGQSLQMVMIVDPMAPWNSLNLGISNPITLQAHSGGCWFLGEEAGQIWQYGWAFQGTPIGSQTLSQFNYGNLLTPETLWTVNENDGKLLFSSGNKVYRYGPATPLVAPELLTDDLDGDVTMVKFLTRETAMGFQYNYDILAVGTEGHLYYIDVSNPSGAGTIIEDIELTGAPVDIYQHVAQ